MFACQCIIYGHSIGQFRKVETDKYNKRIIQSKGITQWIIFKNGLIGQFPSSSMI